MKKYKVLILGGGSGGISVAAKLNRHFDEGEIGIVEPSEKHYYQPYWTLVGAGLGKVSETERDEKSLIPTGVDWIKEKVIAINPDSREVSVSGVGAITYDYLVVATGLQLNWDKIEGLGDQLGKNGICSIYDMKTVERTAEMIQNLQSGTAVFVMPPVPIKCAGAPQKIMYLADHLFRQRGVRDQIHVQFATAGKAMFGVPVFAAALTEIVKERKIEPKYSHKIVGVDAQKKHALFEVTDADGKTSRQSLKYDLLHLVPTMSAHSFIANSPLAVVDGDQKGWLAVHKETLQHLKYPNVFGVGDVTGVPNSKTGAAIRAQYPIVCANLLSVMRGQAPVEKYNGYSSCPLISEIGKVMLAEFGYDGKLLPTFPLNPAIPRRSYWHLKKDLLPKLYWYGMMKGWA